MNLVKRKISDQRLCPICNYEEETIIHSLWDCPANTDVWGEASSPLRKWGIKISKFQDLWAEIMSKIPTEFQELCALICQNIWLCRNSFVFENVFVDPKQLVEASKCQLVSFQQSYSQVEAESNKRA